MEAQRIKVLLIEDNPGDARLIQEMLAQVKDVIFDLEHIDRLFTGLKRLGEGGIDIVLLDLSLPDSKGLETFTEVHSQTPTVPIIVLSGLADEEIAVKAVQEGAQDYLVKGSVDNNLLVRSIRYAIERKRMEEALRVSRESFYNIVERSPDGIVVSDEEGIVHFVNNALITMFGREKEKFVGELFGFPIITGESTEVEIIGKSGEIGVAELRLVETEWEGESAYLTSIRDITERKRSEDQIRAALKEKEVLLKEIHHRVKNNLQVISSLLKLQSRNIKDEKTLEMFKESQNRVRSMALIHEKLYQSSDLANIDFGGYVSDLVGNLFQSYGENTGKVALKKDIEDISLGVEAAIPCGLIINELISNALKYAFPDGRKGEIKIALQPSDENKVRLTVSDNGIGIPENFDIKNTKSLGLHLVNILAEDQLKGEVELDRTNGTKFSIKFGMG